MSCVFVVRAKLDYCKSLNEKKEVQPDFMFSFQFVTSVVSCCPAELKQEIDGKRKTLKGFNVKLQDTILFPEGGGQV